MNKLKLNSELKLYGFIYKVKAISRKGVLFTSNESASELFLSLREVEDIIFST